ncbi:hypothetical protein [Candidatus Electronema sp. PJ]|uniref:hypothetical protein n=1 Tax=Candidatus Electronema sp. PJ TaxID=3401572 RepID=UPI003AA89318
MPFENLLNISVKKDCVDYLAALLTPTIAVAGLYIAFNQRRIEEARLRHELFERRYKQFDAVVKFVFSTTYLSIEADEECECRPFEASNKLRAEIAGMQFIFSPDIDEYVNTHIVELHLEIQHLRAERNRMEPREERLKNAKRQTEFKNNLRKNLEIFHEKTLNYMQLQQSSFSARERLNNLAALFEKIKRAAD